MIDVIIRILKIIIVALNRKNLLSGKDNNKLNEEFDKFRESDKRQQELLKKIKFDKDIPSLSISKSKHNEIISMLEDLKDNIDGSRKKNSADN